MHQAQRAGSGGVIRKTGDEMPCTVADSKPGAHQTRAVLHRQELLKDILQDGMLWVLPDAAVVDLHGLPVKVLQPLRAVRARRRALAAGLALHGGPLRCQGRVRCCCSRRRSGTRP